MPRSKAICLLARPATSPLSTSRSRLESAASLFSMSTRSAFRLIAPPWRSIAAVTPASRTSSSNGFSRKSIAPIFIASTASGTSPWPVMTITGTSIFISRNRFKRSMPLMPGIRTSVITQFKLASGIFSRKATAEEWVTTSIRAVRSRKASDSRNASSSSMIWTVPFSDGIADLLLRHCGQREAEHRSASGIRPRRDRTTMRLHDRARDRQADAHTVAFGGDERLEKLGGDLRRDAGSGVGDGDFDHVVGRQRGRDDEFATLGLLHRRDGITDQVEQHLLDLHFVGQHKIGARIELEAHAHALVLDADQRERARLLDELPHIFHPPLTLAPSDEIAQAADDLAGA